MPSSPRLGLARMQALLARLDDPQNAFRAIHVAGTNGKGSTVAMVEAMLRAGGLRTGRTTSPHLINATERIELDGARISRPRFVALEERVHAAATGMEDPPTFFERVVAMAFTAFADHGVDIAVVEVGLGGRLDATNTVRPLACGVTRVALDHQEYLGDTIAAVAREKAGIFKAGLPAVIAPQEAAAEAALAEVAREVGAPLHRAERSLPAREGGPLAVGLRGEHQQENAALAWALLDACGLAVSPEARRAGLRSLTWPGRIESIGASPEVIVDGAHNPDAMRALVAEIGTGAPVHLLVGLTRGHAGGDTVRPLADLRPVGVWAVQARAPRSRPAPEVAAELAAAGLPARPVAVERALRAAMAAAAEDGGRVLVTGSLYLVGEVRARLLGLSEDPELPRF